MAALDRGWAGRGAPGRGCALRAGLEGASGRGRPGPGAARWGAAPRTLGGLGPGAAAGEDGARPSLCCRRKHKMDAEPTGCPASKKRLTEGAGLGGAPASEQWMPRAAQPAGRGDPPHLCLSSLPGTPGPTEVPCEEMEQAVGDQQCEAARRKLQEIEARITDEDEDGLVEVPLGNMPTLVLSDALKTGLKRDYAGDLTKKIIESM
uniref:Uncharacterized protein n=2 Tax=Sphaerodactylus townsendi TaxID=933632 RepID=A0ACB8G0U0_9SAUR